MSLSNPSSAVEMCSLKPLPCCCTSSSFAFWTFSVHCSSNCCLASLNSSSFSSSNFLSLSALSFFSSFFSSSKRSSSSFCRSASSSAWRFLSISFACSSSSTASRFSSCTFSNSSCASLMLFSISFTAAMMSCLPGNFEFSPSLGMGSLFPTTSLKWETAVSARLTVSVSPSTEVSRGGGALGLGGSCGGGNAGNTGSDTPRSSLDGDMTFFGLFGELRGLL
mmetsp:Transcript_125971/g.364437  ORF Transcript_125971/g.364437 Transcript_125971/m.364437 type:complete len:222 (+) Transcript_125971:2994-3659(+)